MRFGLGSPDLAVYRLVKSGDTGLNLGLNDLFGKDIVFPSLREIIKSFFTGKPIEAKLKGIDSKIIQRLELIQKITDWKIEAEIEKAKRKLR